MRRAQRVLAAAAAVAQRLVLPPTFADCRGLAGMASPSHLLLEPPASVRDATPAELPGVLPFTFAMSAARGRPFLESRGMAARFAPWPEGRPPGDFASPRAPSESFLELTYPFSTSAALRDAYELFQTRTVRLGILLEDLDTFAGDVAARHAGLEGRALVTGYVDSIAWRGGGGGGGGHGPGGGLPLTSDLRLRGQAAWAGCSSLEVHIELASRRGEPSGGGEPSVSGREQRDGGGWAQFGVARFVMVSRDALAGGPKPLPPLAPASALERALFASGAERDVQRRRRREAAASPGPPSAAELGALYAVVRTAAAARAASPAPLAGGGGGGGGRPVPMSATAQVFTHLMHSQDRNQMGRIFGGHVLRLCYEAAFITAVAHAGAACDPGALDDVAFHLPVPIGCILRLEARVAAVAGRLMRVHVRALRLSPAEPAAPARLTNELWLTVYSRAGDAPPVAPATIEEALEAVAAAAQADGGGGAEPLSKL